jgi:nitrite reductase/ring-hydroxylating ferredoxin subunit
MAREIAVPGALEFAALDPGTGAGRLLESGEFRIAVFRTADGWRALDDLCPHRMGPLSEGTLDVTARGTLVTCPFHGWQFDLATGACATVRGKRVRTYPVRVDATGVYVLLPDEADEA